MMVIRVLVTIRPEQRDAFVAYMADEAQQVRQMEGCIRYELYRAASAEGFMLYEEWASAAAFQAYQSSDALKASFATIGPMMAAPPNSAYYEATNIKG